MTNLKAIQFNKASKSEESKQELKKEIDYKALEEALDEIYHSTKKQIGESDYRHIKSIIKKQRSLEVAGRTLLQGSQNHIRRPPDPRTSRCIQKHVILSFAHYMIRSMLKQAAMSYARRKRPKG